MFSITKLIILIRKITLSVIILCSLFFASCRTINIIDTNEKLGIPPSTVIFTFDDGPNQHEETTARLLDVLNKYQVKGVFCVLGVNVLKYPDIIRRIFNEGHIIVNHGFSDKFSIFMNDDEFKTNLLLADRAISDTLGADYNPKLYRPQGGVYNSRQKQILDEEGYLVVPFTVNVIDVFTTSSGQKRLAKRIINKVLKQNSGIILLHDGRAAERRERSLNRNPRGSFNRSWIPDLVEEIIITLLDNGFNVNESFGLIDVLTPSVSAPPQSPL